MSLKAMIFEAFIKVWARDSAPEELAILIDEEFGSQILKKVKKVGIQFALTVEKSGREIFDFEYGDKFGDHLKSSNHAGLKLWCVIIRHTKKKILCNKNV